jgi:hypothetical protein
MKNMTRFCSSKPCLPVTGQIGLLQQHKIHDDLLMAPCGGLRCRINLMRLSPTFVCWIRARCAKMRIPRATNSSLFTR